MQNALHKVVKIVMYAVLAVLAFAASFILGGNRTNVSQTESASDKLSIAPKAYADVPYSQASYGGSEGAAGSAGGSEGSGEGSGSEGGSSSGG